MANIKLPNESRLLKIVAVCLMTVGFAGCGNQNKNAEKPSKIIPVKIQTIGFTDLQSLSSYVGTVEESCAFGLSFANTGRVEHVLVSEGQKVSKGQLLATLNSSTAQNAYDLTKASLTQAQDAYDRLKPMYDKGSLTEIKLVEVETGLEKAKAMEAISRNTLNDCKLYAPCSGVIAKRLVNEGEQVLPDVPVFKVVTVDEVNVKVPVPEREIGMIKTGQLAIIHVSALNDKEYNGIVDRKGVEANPVSHTYEVKVRVKNPEGELMPGMVCKIVLMQNDVARKQIIVPNRVVQLSPDNKRFVWLVEGTVARRRFITTGNLTDSGVEVLSGISEGDTIIIDGFQKVSEGMRVSITN
jgi:RND family efflux transporter MFP subunit